MSLAEAWRSADDVAEDDERFMRAALEQAKRAALEGEVPIGAVVVCQGEVIAEARNHREADADPSAHAEFSAIMQASMRGSTIHLKFSRACLRANVLTCFRNSSKRVAARNRKAMT